MRGANQVWRICRSVHRVKKVGNIGTSSKSYHTYDNGVNAVSWTASDATHDYSITLTEEQIREAYEYLQVYKKVK